MDGIDVRDLVDILETFKLTEYKWGYKKWKGILKVTLNTSKQY